MGFTIDGDCIDDVFDGYSDDELQEFDEAAANGESSPIIDELLACADLSG